MCVGMGSFSDPFEAQGLAHFLGLVLKLQLPVHFVNRLNLVALKVSNTGKHRKTTPFP